MEKLQDKYKNNERVDILVENTDFGVGDQNEKCRKERIKLQHFQKK